MADVHHSVAVLRHLFELLLEVLDRSIPSVLALLIAVERASFGGTKIELISPVGDHLLMAAGCRVQHSSVGVVCVSHCNQSDHFKGRRHHLPAFNNLILPLKLKVAALLLPPSSFLPRKTSSVTRNKTH